MEVAGSALKRERRCEPRYRVMLDGRVHVPLASSEGPSLVARARVENLSQNGARVFVDRLKREHVSLLEEGGRKCSVICCFPDSSLPHFLSGDIVWTSVDAADPQATARLGIHLTDMPSRERGALNRFLATLSVPGQVDAQDHPPMQ